MDAEAGGPNVLVANPVSTGRLCAVSSNNNQPVAGAGRLQIVVNHVETEIGVRRDVPLGAGTDPPPVPVVVAASLRQSSPKRNRTGGAAFKSADQVVSVVGIALAAPANDPANMPSLWIP